jgi:N-acetylglucosaminyl-diphospho-decaprenol L-rhamnosyltransferase
MQPPLSVVFVCHHSTQLVSIALESLRRAEPDLGIELIVVDNGSGERAALARVCASYEARLLLLSRNLGYGAAANRGFARSNGRYVATANPDVTFRGGAVGELVRFLDRNPQAGVAGPQLFYSDGVPQPSARRYPRLGYVLAGRRSPLARVLPGFRPARDFQYLGLEKAAAPVEVEAVIGTFAVFRREAFEGAGGFDERFFMFAEDMDICRRLWQRGWKVYLVPQSRIEHRYGATRRLYRRFTEFQRVKALTRFLGLGRRPVGRALVGFAGAGYYFGLEAAALVGLGEYERSWHLRAPAAAETRRPEAGSV